VERNVPLAQASMDEVVLPERVQEALGQLVGSAREGLLALSVGVGPAWRDTDLIVKGVAGLRSLYPCVVAGVAPPVAPRVAPCCTQVCR